MGLAFGQTQASASAVAACCVFFSLTVSSMASEWNINSIDGMRVSASATMQFNADGGISGSTGCNRFTGGARFESGSIVFERPLAMTRMACPSDDLMRQENLLVGLLIGRIQSSYDPFLSELTLTSNGSSIVLSRVPDQFGPELPKTHGGRDRPVGEPPYLAAFGLAEDLPVRATPSRDAQIVGAVWMGQVLRNAGCEDIDGSQWCQVSTMDDGLSGWSEGTNLEVANGALRAGQELFDAAGLVPCAKGYGAPMWQCSFGVARDGQGNATVAVKKTEGTTRFLSFEDGMFSSSDTSEAGGGFETSATREADLNLIRVDDERYEIPDVVVWGG